MDSEPIFDLAHLGHMELLTPKPDESLRFFLDVMGMTETAREGESVYLRGWDDYEHHSLKLTAHKTSGMRHMAFRTRSPQALERRAHCALALDDPLEFGKRLALELGRFQAAHVKRDRVLLVLDSSAM